MALYSRNSEKRRIFNELKRQQDEVIGGMCRLGNRPISPKSQMEQEKRIRREIANSNERRRMKSINAGFQSLRQLLPQQDGEKLSKAAILQNTAEYIYQLEQEKARLLVQNCQLKRMLNSQMNVDSDGSSSDSPLPKRKKTDTVESSDEGIGSMSPRGSTSNMTEEMKQEMIDLRDRLHREHQLQIEHEKQTHSLDIQMYDDQVPGTIEQHLPEKAKVEQHYSYILNKEHLSSPTAGVSQNESDSSEGSVPLPLTDIPEDLSGKSSTVLSSHSSDTEMVSSSQLYVLDSSVLTSKPIHLVSNEVCISHLKPANTKEPTQYATLSRTYQANSTSRQNLETIVEAIRHLEGDHMFRDDPEPFSKPESERTVSDNVSSNELLTDPFQILCETTKSSALHSQVFQCSSSTQTRPGVIVTNHS
ncbi:transcription factor AP-4-like isoform X2 [Limulus polyphemus]|uniref:Transcription factor AP-4-like isoform X2 n=1 Tax=Limulus polyphemus TaxID=6850 RepID=A0ABM1S150_LIMPO|nr:transcription factor AP-4-like isoform X2 [Limulus polyphemus]